MPPEGRGILRILGRRRGYCLAIPERRLDSLISMVVNAAAEAAASGRH
jgi:hypothetical protein